MGRVATDELHHRVGLGVVAAIRHARPVSREEIAAGASISTAVIFIYILTSAPQAAVGEGQPAPSLGRGLVHHLDGPAVLLRPLQLVPHEGVVDARVVLAHAPLQCAPAPLELGSYSI
jgi:hypothetical protein